MARPGMLMIPTSVADVSCHAVSPGFNQLGSGTSALNMRAWPPVFRSYCLRSARPVAAQCNEFWPPGTRGSIGIVDNLLNPRLLTAHEPKLHRGDLTRPCLPGVRRLAPLGAVLHCAPGIL